MRAAVVALFPFGAAAEQACSGPPRRRAAWGAMIAASIVAAEVATWLLLDPRSHVDAGLEFLVAQSCVTCVAVQLLQGPAVAGLRRGTSAMRLAALPIIGATMWLSAVPAVRAQREITRQHTLAASSAAQTGGETGADGGAEAAVALFRARMDLGHSYPRSVASGAGSAALQASLADCGTGDGGACETARSLTDDKTAGTLDDPWSILLWIGGLRRMRPDDGAQRH